MVNCLWPCGLTLFVYGVIDGVLPAQLERVKLLVKYEVLQLAQHHHQLQAEHLLAQLIVATNLSYHSHCDLQRPYAEYDGAQDEWNEEEHHLIVQLAITVVKYVHHQHYRPLPEGHLPDHVA